MRTLWTYGCSHTDGFRKEENIIASSRAYIVLHGDDARTNWTKHLAEKLNYNLNNYGESGVGNDYIFNEFLKTFHNIRRGDTVIVQWTYMNRFRFASPYDESTWFKVVPHTLLDYEGFSSQTQQEIMDNRDRRQWFVDIKNKMDMIDNISKLIGFNLFFWSADERILYNEIYESHRAKCIMYDDFVKGGGFFDTMSRLGCKTIREETNDVIPDPHLSIEGNKILAEKFHSYLIENQQQIII